jgi:hypothetical protein
MEDVKAIDDMGTSVSPSDLKRKREERGEDSIMDEEFTESMIKKVKGTENEPSPKVNGIYKSEDFKPTDVTETGMNGVMAKTAF